MQIQKKMVILGLIAILGIVSVSAQDVSLEKLNASINGITDGFTRALTFNSTLGLNWSDAYIGQIVGAPPHFGFGISAGLSTMNIGRLTGDFKSAGIMSSGGPSMFSSGMSYLPIPTGLVELRIGGFMLPFDVGVKVDLVPSLEMPLGDVKTRFDYTFFGFDVRYGILEDRLFIPGVSLAAGFNFTNGQIRAGMGEVPLYTFSGYTASIANPSAGFGWENFTLDFRAQVSKKLLIITPYAGLGASFGWSALDYGLSGRVTFKDPKGAIVNEDAVKDQIPSGILDVDDGGISASKKNFDFGLRAFGGFSLNIFVIKIDMTAMFNFLDQNFGGSVGIRFQL
jgi:hypothetical protein